jgi:uncharacterized membrane protein YdbT with pleckstrin-like domain
MSQPTQPSQPWDFLPEVPPKLTFLERWRAARQLRLESAGEITWRRHWAFLLRRMVGPVLYWLIGSGVMLVLGYLPKLGLAVWAWWLVFVLGVMTPAVLGALWEYGVWGGDIYRLTDERIIDIERLPLGLRETSRESELDRIQDIDVDIPNILARFFNVGHVKIKTGAAGSDLTFLGVADPYSIQRDIWHRLAMLRRKKDQRQHSQRDEEMLAWFKQYENLPPK